MNFLARHLSTRFAALHQSSRSYPELQSRAANARGQYRNYALTGLAILALALLTLPLAQTKSSAHGGKGPEVQKHGPRFAKAPNKTPVSILAQPNDVCAGAIPIALRQSVDGSFSTATNDYTLSCGVGCFTGVGQTVSTAPGRDVVYSFTAPVTGSYSFKVVQATSPSNLVLYTAATCPAPGVVAATRASNRNTTGFSEEVDCQAMTSGQQVFIFVDEDTVGTSTTFKIEATQCQQETEPNNTPATANPFVFGVEGSISPGTDVDYFSLGTTVPGSRVFALADGSAGKNQSADDIDMRVTTTTDTLEYDDDNAYGTFGTFAPVIGGRAITGTSTFLQITPFGGTANEPYRLYAVVEPPGANPITACPTQTTSAIDETEPNDDSTTANTSPGGLGYFEGELNDVDDFDDFYAIDAKAGDIIFASLDLDPCRDNTTFDGDLFFVDSDGITVLASGEDGGDLSTSDNTSGAGDLFSTTPFSPAEALVYRVQTTGTYYVVAEEFDGAGDYLLAVSRNSNLGTGPTAAGGTIRGQIAATDGTPLSGVSMDLSGSTSAHTITDSNGRYSFAGLTAGGFYTVTPLRANYSFSPASRSLSLIELVADAAFTARADTIQTGNAIDSADFFVRQQYLDFLGREPDQGGLAFWTAKINACGTDAACTRQQRIEVSAAFFQSDEFQQTGSFVYRMYKAGLGRELNYQEFSADHSLVVDNGSLSANRAAFANLFVQRAEFAHRYNGANSASSFVDALLQNIRQTDGVDLSAERDAFVAKYQSGSSQNDSRSLVLRDAIEAGSFQQAETNPSFVLIEYFGYLRRDADSGGYSFWLDVLNNRAAGNYRSMVCAFLTSSEYQRRFGSVVTRTNGECAQ